MKIEVLGTGCPKCVALMDNVVAAVAELGIEEPLAKLLVAAASISAKEARSIKSGIKQGGKEEALPEGEAEVKAEVESVEPALVEDEVKTEVEAEPETEGDSEVEAEDK